MPSTAFLVPYHFVPPINGGHRAAYGFAEFLSRERKMVCLSSHNNEAQRAPFPVVTLFGDRPWKYVSPVVGLRLYRYLRREGVRTLILHQHFMGLLALPLKVLLRLRLVIFVQNIEYQRFRSLGKWWWLGMFLFEWLVYRGSDYLLFISPDDQAPAIHKFGLAPERCRVVPYGTPLREPPADRREARRRICQRHGFDNDSKLFIFFGPQSYLPNLEAVETILHQINPAFRDLSDIPYRILICGGGLPPSYRHLEDYQAAGVHYLGFVEDIDEYVKAADLMLNPITTGGGVKTKVIESIALGTPVISFASGAKGVDPGVCGSALQVVPDGDIDRFCRQMLVLSRQDLPPVPSAFYEYYYWAAAIRPALEVLP